MLPPASRKALRHRDRWRVVDMLREQPDLTAKDAGRDMDLWRHLFAPDEIVRVGRYLPRSVRGRSSRVVLGQHLGRRRHPANCGAVLACLSTFARSNMRRHNDATRGVRSRYRQAAQC